MNHTFSLEKVGKTGDLNADLIMRQYKLDKTAKFREIKSINPKLKQSETTRELKNHLLHYNGKEENQTWFHHIEYVHHQKLIQQNKRLQTILSLTSK